MLEFFRRYQKVLFIVITVVIVISFSFFGTSGAVRDVQQVDKVLFTGATGKKIYRSELDSLVSFLGTDAQDKLHLAGAWGPNFLNDGVVRKDFLESGFAVLIAERFMEDLESDLQTRASKEARYEPYVHPYAKFINAESSWLAFAPPMKSAYDQFKASLGQNTPEAFNDRVNLYLEESKFPAHVLKQVVRYQESQYSGIRQDPSLIRRDLSLFSYHSVQDWFGARFIHLVAQTIMNVSDLAESQGYRVSDEEVMADLVRNSEMSFQQLKSQVDLGVVNGTQYFQRQLQILHMDRASAVKLWRRVMLFRRMVHEVGHSLLVDSLMYQRFQDYAEEGVELAIFKIPHQLRFEDYRALQKFEAYLTAAGEGYAKSNNRLAIPEKSVSADTLKTEYPELVKKRYRLRYRVLQKDTLRAKVGLKEAWAWQLEEANWIKLVEKYPELGAAGATDELARFSALEALGDKTRDAVNVSSRQMIVEEHPEWIKEELEKAEEQEVWIDLRLAGGKAPLEGIKNRQQLMEVLDAASIASDDESGEQAQDLMSYTQDQKYYYSIEVLERTEDLEVLSYQEAEAAGVLDDVLNRVIQKAYEQMKKSKPDTLKDTAGSWKSLSDVRHLVIEELFNPLVQDIFKEFKEQFPNKAVSQKASGAFCAPLRFIRYMKDEKEKFMAGNLDSALDGKSDQKEFSSQWKIDMEMLTANRASDNLLNIDDALNLEKDDWSSIQHDQSNGLYFYRVMDRGSEGSAVAAMMDQGQELLSHELELEVMEKLLDGFVQEKMYSLDYFIR